MHRGLRKQSLLAIMLAFAFSFDARAEMVLDQEYDFTSSIADSTNGNISEVAQTFTVGIAGQLDRIDVLMFRLGGFFDPTGDPILNLYSTVGGVPTGETLATVSVAESLVPFSTAAFVTFDLSGAGLSFDVGDVLAFGISTTSEIGPYFLPSDDDTGAPGDYTRGAAFRRTISPEGAWQALSPAQDHGFRTYVTPVPEPSTVLLGALGFASISLVRRRRK